jgi:hypothetical protein
MSGVPRELAEHSLHVRPNAKPVKQPLRCFAEEKRKAISEEIAWLLTAGFIMCRGNLETVAMGRLNRGARRW